MRPGPRPAWSSQAAIPVAGAPPGRGPRELQETDLTGAKPLGQQPLPAGATVYVSATRDSGWRLHQGSVSVAPQPAFGWAMSFPVPTGGERPAAAHRTLRPGLARRSVRPDLLWLAAIVVAAVDLRRRRAEHPPSETVHPEWFAPTAPASSRAGWRRGGASGGLGSDDLKGDEVWVDV